VCTDGSGSGTGSTSISKNGISIGNGNYIGEISSSSITASRIYALPNASGTLALTSELTNVVYSNQDADINAEWTFYNDVEIEAGANIIIKSPNGTRYRITVDNSGNLRTQQV